MRQLAGYFQSTTLSTTQSNSVREPVGPTTNLCKPLGLRDHFVRVAASIFALYPQCLWGQRLLFASRFACGIIFFRVAARIFTFYPRCLWSQRLLFFKPLGWRNNFLPCCCERICVLPPMQCGKTHMIHAAKMQNAPQLRA